MSAKKVKLTPVEGEQEKVKKPKAKAAAKATAKPKAKAVKEPTSIPEKKKKPTAKVKDAQPEKKPKATVKAKDTPSEKKKKATEKEPIPEKLEKEKEPTGQVKGKQDILKALDGIPGAEKLADLIEHSKKKGKLSAGELMEALEDVDLEGDQLDKLYDLFESMGIDAASEYYADLENLEGLEGLETRDQDAPPPAAAPRPPLF